MERVHVTLSINNYMPQTNSIKIKMIKTINFILIINRLC